MDAIADLVRPGWVVLADWQGREDGRLPHGVWLAAWVPEDGETGRGDWEVVWGASLTDAGYRLGRAMGARPRQEIARAYAWCPRLGGHRVSTWKPGEQVSHDRVGIGVYAPCSGLLMMYLNEAGPGCELTYARYFPRAGTTPELWHVGYPADGDADQGGEGEGR